MRVLIIEDEIIIARFLEQQLVENFSCSTQVALNHQEVMSAMPKFLPHLVLCDINLREEENGISLMEKLSTDYLFEIIFITSYQSRAVIESASTLHPLNYIIKPVDESALFAALKIAWPVLTANQRLGVPSAENELDRILSSTEKKIVELIRLNRTTREIAAELFVSPYTIKNHRHRICQKLGLKNENNALLQWVMQRKEV